MSWAAYVKNLEDGPGKCTYAGIFGRQGGVWGESENKSGFPVTQEDVIHAVNIMVGNDQSVFANGMQVGGVKFTCLGLEPEVLILQGKSPYSDYSLVIALSASAAVVGFNSTAEVKTQMVRTGVEGIRDYLKGVGY